MKKFITILMMALCLATFTSGDAQAKVRKKTRKAHTTQVKTLHIDLIILDYTEDGWDHIHVEGNNGEVVATNGDTYRLEVVSRSGKELILNVIDSNGNQVGQMKGEYLMYHRQVTSYVGTYYSVDGEESDFSFWLGD